MGREMNLHASLLLRAAEAVFDHSSHYEYLMEAAWEAVEQLHKQHGSFNEIVESTTDESIATQMVRGRGLRRSQKSPLVLAPFQPPLRSVPGHERCAFRCTRGWGNSLH